MTDRPNRLVVIGPLGLRTAYLNVDRETAIVNYMADQVCFEGDTPEPPRPEEIREFTFTDSFQVYDAGPASGDDKS